MMQTVSRFRTSSETPFSTCEAAEALLDVDGADDDARSRAASVMAAEGRTA